MGCPLLQCLYLAGVSAQKVRAGGAVLAGVGAALIHLLFAVTSCVAHLAVAVVNIFHIQTPARVVAQVSDVNTCQHRQDLSGSFQNKSGLIKQWAAPRPHLSVWPPPRRTHSGRHSRVPSNRSCTRRCSWSHSANTFLRSYRERIRTKESNSGCLKNRNTKPTVTTFVSLNTHDQLKRT